MKAALAIALGFILGYTASAAIPAPSVIIPVGITNYVYYTNIITDTNIYWNDVRLPLSMLRAPGVKPDYGNWTNSLYGVLFDDASTESVYSEMQIPHGVVTNNAYGLRLHLHFTSANGPSGANTNVVFGLEYTMAAVYGTFPTSLTLYATNGLPSAGFHQIAAFGPITNLTDSAVLSMRLFRFGNNASDTFAGDIVGLSFDGHVPVDKLGSLTEYPQ